MNIIKNKYMKILFTLICLFLLNEKVDAITYKCDYTISDSNFLNAYSMYGELEVMYATDYEFNLTSESRYYYIFPNDGNIWDIKKGEEENSNNILYNSSRFKVYNSIPFSTWNSNGCLKEIYVAYNTSSAGIGFTQQNNLSNVGFEGMDAIAKATLVTSNDFEDTYTVTFLGNDSVDRVEVKHGELVERPSVRPQKKDHTFICWENTLESGCFNFSTPITSQLTLQAKFTEKIEISTLKGTVNCAGAEIPYVLPYAINKIIVLLKILAPIILIVLGMIDFAKATIASDERQMKEVSSKFGRRVFAAVAIFFVIAIVQFAFRMVGEEDDGVSGCFNCFVNGDCTK